MIVGFISIKNWQTKKPWAQMTATDAQMAFGALSLPITALLWNKLYPWMSVEWGEATISQKMIVGIISIQYWQQRSDGRKWQPTTRQPAFGALSLRITALLWNKLYPWLSVEWGEATISQKMIVGIISIKYWQTKKPWAQMTSTDAATGLWSARFADNSFTVE